MLNDLAVFEPKQVVAADDLVDLVVDDDAAHFRGSRKTFGKSLQAVAEERIALEIGVAADLGAIRDVRRRCLYSWRR